MEDLVARTEASPLARERAKMILLTLQGSWSVKDALARMDISRTRFQDLRRQMLEAAVGALEPGPVGRPPTGAAPEAEAVARLKAQVRALERQVREAEALRRLAEGGLLPAIRRRQGQKGAR
jgi:hypothetical protein